MNRGCAARGAALGETARWSQLRSLNPYRYSPSKAARLLEGLGFHKKAGRGLLPNGKPFKLSAIAPNGQPQNVMGIDSVAKSLTTIVQAEVGGPCDVLGTDRLR